jgi:hypothetical protein
VTTRTDYRVEPVAILGPRWGLTTVWRIHAGPNASIVAEFPSRREALDELAVLVNEAYKRDA